MKNKFLILILAFVVFSCSDKNKIPPLLTDKVSPGNVVLNAPVISPGNGPVDDSANIYPDLISLEKYNKWYLGQSPEFSLNSLQQLWEKVKMEPAIEKFTLAEWEKWFETSGLLLQLTGEAKYAEEMEKIIFARFQDVPEGDIQNIENMVVPYIFTRNVDHIHVNIFTPSEISYEHSLHGKVKIIQEPDFAGTGDFTIRFRMEQKQYVELFVRIPSWAEGATVTVKKVKYFAPAGGYCQIAKKWKEGDVVEIHFPPEKIPAYLRQSN